MWSICFIAQNKQKKLSFMFVKLLSLAFFLESKEAEQVMFLEQFARNKVHKDEM